MSRVFISYSEADTKFVHRLTGDLEKAGIQVFYDKRMSAGESWASVLEDAIDQADYVLIVMSPEYFSSNWAQQEMTLALSKRRSGDGRVIPLLVKKAKIPPLLNYIQYADFTGSYEQTLPSLLEVIVPSKTPSDTVPFYPKTVSDSVPTAGELVKGVSAVELESLRKELREAVQLFKAKPSEVAQAESYAEKGKNTKGNCFVIMPFGNADLDVVYEDYVKPITEASYAFHCERGDDIFGSNVIVDDILTSIKSADFVIAELTGKNANVFYEVGICHALGKNVLLLVQSIDDVPFDLRHRRVLVYEYTPRGVKRLETSLKEHLGSMVSQLKNNADRT